MVYALRYSTYSKKGDDTHEYKRIRIVNSKSIKRNGEVKGYKEKTIKSEQFTFNCLLKYCEKNTVNYNDKMGFKFLEEHYHLSKLSSRSKCRRIRSI